MILEKNGEPIETDDKLPLLPLRDVVLFPHMSIPLLVGRVPSVNAIEDAVSRDRFVFAVAQQRPEIVNPEKDELYKIGTVVRVLQLFRLPDGTMRVLVEGVGRARVKRFIPAGEFNYVKLEPLTEEKAASPEIEALMRNVLASFNDYVHLNRRVSDEVLLSANNITDAGVLGHTIAAHLLLKVSAKQEILEIDNPVERLNHLSKVLAQELEIVKLERKIEGQVRSQVHRNQREFYLNEQLKAIRKELGYQNEFASELEDLEREIKKARMPKEIHERATKELDRLGKMSFMSPEATVVRNYIDWLVSLPWKKRTNDNLDIDAVEKVLEEDHYGLRKVKDRILEYLSVLKLSGNLKGPILCFVGPPGVGKTSLGKSIARALGRNFVRMSLGGIRDEAEIRGHRRTYIGSMPGRILQAMKRAGSVNPLILLDEIDKLGADFRGDPAAALLEVLDPEQNQAFNDHYLEVDYDLSQVLFLTTANTLWTIPPALRDRMEVIHLPGYLEHEKKAIAKSFLLTKQKKAAGLKPEDLKLTDGALDTMITAYTREAGVRNLEREIATVCRKVARKRAQRPNARYGAITSKMVPKYLGPPKFIEPPIEKKRRVGIATGLAWTEAGGDVMTIEVAVLPGKGELLLTGQLGEQMRESGVAALSYARERGQRFGLDKWFYKDIDVHVHVPEGAIPKDGPSAGITIATALISALTGIPTRHDVAMTGEITLRGNVLAIGGLNEKTVAAKRMGVSTVLIPKANEKDIPELPKEVRDTLTIVPVESMDDVLEHAFAKPKPESLGAKGESPGLYAH